MGLLVTLHLITANVYNSVDGPKNRGFSYIEIWMIFNQFIICFAIMEFVCILAFVKYFCRQHDSKTHEAKIKKLDFITFLISMMMYLIFNIFFWTLT